MLYLHPIRNSGRKLFQYPASTVPIGTVPNRILLVDPLLQKDMWRIPSLSTGTLQCLHMYYLSSLVIDGLATGRPDDSEVWLVCCQPQHNQISVRSTQYMLHITVYTLIQQVQYSRQYLNFFNRSQWQNYQRSRKKKLTRNIQTLTCTLHRKNIGFRKRWPEPDLHSDEQYHIYQCS